MYSRAANVQTLNLHQSCNPNSLRAIWSAQLTTKKNPPIAALTRACAHHGPRSPRGVRAGRRGGYIGYGGW